MSDVTDPIMVIDDSLDDVLLLKRAIAKARLSNPIDVLEGGEAAIAYLTRRLAEPEVSLPVVALLDLKMPRVSGFDVLEWVRARPRLKAMPVVVFTSSREDPDLERAYALGANSYLVKPVRFEDLAETVRVLGLYWCIHNQRPTG